MAPVSILIMAAGSSARMRGEDKLVKPFNGTTLLGRAASVAYSSKADHVLTVLPMANSARQAALPENGACLLLDAEKPALSQSIRAGVAALDPGNDILILLADMPGITTAHLNALIDARKNHPKASIFRLASAGGLPGHPVLFANAFRDALTNLDGDKGAAALIRANTKRVHLVRAGDDAPLIDLDTPEDWAAYSFSGLT